MSDYHCFFLDEQDQVSGSESLMDHRNDAEACQLAVKILSERSHHHALELWDGSRMISKHGRVRA